MKIKRSYELSALSPLMLFAILAAALALACSSSTSKPKSTTAPQATASTSQQQAANPQTPRVTQRVYSPLVASGGTPQTPPGVKISVQPTTLKVGDNVTITVTVTNIDVPTYLLFVRDSGVIDVSKMVGVTYQNERLTGTSTSNLLELVSTQGAAGQAVFVLHATQAGAADVWASALIGGATASASTGWVSEIVRIQVSK